MKFSIASSILLASSILTNSHVSAFTLQQKHVISKNSMKHVDVSPSIGKEIPTSLFSTAMEAEQETPETTMRSINLFNSLSNQKEPFKPIQQNTVSMYTCGPTIYDHAHVGNFRAFLTYDILKRALLYFGYDVHHICNLTDVDDKIIKRCTELNISLQELTNKYEMFFKSDLEALNIIPAKDYPRATEHIDEMVSLIQELADKGYAYQSEEGSWYFNVEKKEGYGQQLVKLNVDAMKQNASGMAGKQRIDSSDVAATSEEDSEEDDLDADEYDADKVGARDFALWKAYKPKFDREDAIWDTVIGKGRPGWHLECSAMARKYLGDTIDIHCGGIDLKFPHHENEIAQSEAASGEKFCNCWLHNGFVNIGEKDEKMSKSKGNFLTLRTACPTSDDVRAYRYLVVSSQYRNPLSFTDAAMGAAKGALKRMDNVMKQLDEALEGFEDSGNNTSDMATKVEKELSNFETALSDDLSMPRAAASLFGVVKVAETEFKRLKKEEKDAKKNGGDITPLDLNGLNLVRNAIQQMDKVFGVFYTVPKELNDDGTEKESEDDKSEEVSIPEDVMKLVNERTAAKDSKDWDAADSLRKQIAELGYAVKDVKGGDPIVTRI